MVKVTEKYLMRKISKNPQILTKKKKETDQEHLNRVTHLYLQSQYVDHIAPMQHCSSATVVYLQNNQLKTIHNMENFPNLQYLYLQNNRISKMENLNCLKNLKKLYLGSNEISVLEGLEDMRNLIELHVESQRLPPGGTLFFDPRTTKSLGETLRVLNVAQNKLLSMQGVKNLKELRCLNASDNSIADVEDVADSLQSLRSLESLKLTGNPIAGNRKYQEFITLASRSLKFLDDKVIRPETRTFLENLATSKVSLCNWSAGKAKTFPNSDSDFVKSQDRDREQKNFHPISSTGTFPLTRVKKCSKNSRTVSACPDKVTQDRVHEPVKVADCGRSSEQNCLS